MNEDKVRELGNNSIAHLQSVEECLNTVMLRLESKRNSPHVERFPEKNTLTHDCTEFYDLWRRTHGEWVTEVCRKSRNLEKCSDLEAQFKSKNAQVRQTMCEIFHMASLDEIKAYETNLTTVTSSSWRKETIDNQTRTRM
eukprot:TRINITY_DN422_c0_g2_i1.p1 TRINITY_DN422_c0_g2~~TRINITY_DN422_c0_g2_i1.p1  ORF type:complete len:140 (-),score=15.15 TRINITY_DN422_c0_g2_i1:120-539(-)